MKGFAWLVVPVFILMSMVGCGTSTTKPNAATNTNTATTKTPVFRCSTSEYPSWSTLLVAFRQGLLDPAEGKQGTVEKEWNVDIVLKEADYDTCLTLYGNGSVDANCQTNMDSLSPALGRKTVAVCPTSTSVGADACVVVNIADLDELKSKTTYGLEKSVSQFAWYGSLIKAGKDPKEYTYKNMDPGAAAQAMQNGQDEISAIQVWNPFVLQTLRSRSGSKVLLSSETIPEQIIDMIVVGEDVLHKPGGEDFACALIDTYYRVCGSLGPSLGTKEQTGLTADQSKTLVGKLNEQQKETLVALGSKFSSLPAEDMAICTHQTVFYRNATEGVELFTRKAFQEETTPFVTKFCIDYKILDKEPSIAFGSYKEKKAQLIFDPQFMQRVAAKKK